MDGKDTQTPTCRCCLDWLACRSPCKAAWLHDEPLMLLGHLPPVAQRQQAHTIISLCSMWQSHGSPYHSHARLTCSAARPSICARDGQELLVAWAISVRKAKRRF